MPWLLSFSVAWFATVAFLIVRALRQQRNLERLERCGTLDAVPVPKIGVIVPARDEAFNIEACLQTLIDQAYPRDRLEFWVVDDGSRDETPLLVERLACADKRLTLIRSPSLPQGWTGKSHACWLAARSVAADVQWLCFIDADMRAEPQLLSSSVNCVTSEQLALLSLAPRHELKSFAERLIIPCGLCFLGFRQDLRGARPEHPGDVVATGQFFLAHRDTYESLGGHAAVRSEICEDLELARLFRSGGKRFCLKDAGTLLSTRMYTGWNTLWAGFAKNLTELLGGTWPAIVAALTSLVLTWAAVLLPIVDSAACGTGSAEACVALWPAAAASIAILALHVACAIHLRIPFWYGFLFPAGYTVGVVMTFDSVRWRFRGRVSWKGRQYVRPRPGPGRL